MSRADEGTIDAALRLAVLEDDVAAMPDALDTVLGPRGVRLSGGQLQRAAAARAFLRDADLVVVDDPSSALDVETEERMWARLLERTRGTLLIVSNRPEVVARADQVLAARRRRGGRLSSRIRCDTRGSSNVCS